MAKRSVWHLSGVLAAGLAATFVSGAALAQEPAPPPQEPAKAGEETQQEGKFVEEMVVTAQKREENVQDVPLAVSTLSGSDLLAVTAGAPDIRFLSARVPSLTLESSFGRAFPRFYIRGLGNTDFDLNASQPVSMLVDEIVLENPVVKGMPLWDLDRIEVLRGPQGTLFGRNTPAGVVKFETRKPTQEFESQWRMSYGTFDSIDISGGVGGPLTDTLSARFSGLYQSRKDWVDNLHTGEANSLGGYDTLAYRLQFLWEPSEDFSGLLNVHGWDLTGTARIFRANIIKPGTNDLVGGFDQEKVYFDGLNQQDITGQGAVLKLEYDLGAATLTSVTGYETLEMYSRGDIDGGFGAAFLGEGNYGPGFIPFSSESADGIPDIDQLTQEVRVASTGDGDLSWLAGAFYFNEDLEVDSFSYDSLTAGNPQNGYATQAQDSTAYALFGSVTYRLNELWTLAGGLRWSHDERDFVADRPQPLFQPPLVAPIERSVDDDNVSWDLSATYKLDADVNLYGRVATSYRAPSIQGRIMFAPDFEGGTNPATNGVTVADTEEILSFETGIKSILAGNRLRFNADVFYYEVDGQQLTAVGGEYNIATLLNVDTTEGYGFEADVEFIPSANWWVAVGLSYNKTELKDPGLTVSPCGGGCTVTNRLSADGTLAYIDGNPLPNAPEWIFAGVLNYQSSPVSKGLFGALDWSYYSDKNFFLYESEEFHGDGFEVGLRVGYGWKQGTYEVALFGRNIFDEDIVQGGIDFNNLTGMTNDPRTIGVEFVLSY